MNLETEKTNFAPGKLTQNGHIRIYLSNVIRLKT